MPRQAPRPQPRRRPVPAPPAEPHRRPRRARFQATRGGTAGRSRSRRSMQGRGHPGRRWRLVGPGHDRGGRRPTGPRGGRRRGRHGRQDRGDRRGNRGAGSRRAGHGVAVAAQHDRERDRHADRGQHATGHDGTRAEAYLFHAGVERALQLAQTWSPPVSHDIAQYMRNNRGGFRRARYGTGGSHARPGRRRDVAGRDRLSRSPRSVPRRSGGPRWSRTRRSGAWTRSRWPRPGRSSRSRRSRRPAPWSRRKARR